MTVTTTAIPQVLDALLSLFRSMSAVTGNPPIPVYDGFPGEKPGDTFIIVGGWDPQTAAGNQVWHSLGAPSGVAPSRKETVSFNCAVSAFVGGEGATGTVITSDAQKTARDKAFTLVQACQVAVSDDPSLINTIGDGIGLGTGWLEFGTRLELDQTDINDPDLELGRRSTVLFEVTYTKYLYNS